MKKRKLALSLLLAMSVGVVSGCNNGGVARLEDENGNEIVLKIGDTNISVETLFHNVMLTQAGVKSIYDAVDSVVIQASYAVTDEVQEKIDELIKTFETETTTEASSYGYSFTAMRDIKLRELGLKTMDDLKVYYKVQVLREKVIADYFPTTYPNVGGQRNALVAEYVEAAAPMHLKHALATVTNTDLYEGAVTESEALKIATIGTRLANGTNFAKVAYEESQDTGSATKSGDLGIMDTYTSYVSEFKYGVYSYLVYGEYANDPKLNDIKAVLDVPASMDAIYADGFRAIPVSEFATLAEVADDTIDPLTTKVYEDEQDYPRNKLFNDFLNLPSVAFISYDSEVPAGANTATVDYIEGATEPQTVVADENGNPIIVVRSQFGIHFISVTRSAFEEKAVEYYTETKDVDLTDNFVPFIVQGSTTSGKTANYKAVSDAVTNYIGGAALGLTADTNLLNYRIFDYYLDKEDISFTDVTFNYGYDNKTTTLESLVTNYIASQEEAKQLQVDTSILNAWTSYQRKIEREAEYLG